MILLLMGLRGSGKSTLAPLVAEMLGWTFADLDEDVARRLGFSTPSEAFASDSAAFRGAERDALALRLASPGNLVVALGGGTPEIPECARLIRQARASGAGMVAYLRLEPPVLAARLAAQGAARPALTALDGDAEVEAIFTRRDPLYRTLGDVTMDPSGQSPAETARALVERVRGAGW